MFFAVVAQLVERRLAKAKVASPSLVYRSIVFYSRALARLRAIKGMAP